jgi:hypothetical protein
MSGPRAYEPRESATPYDLGMGTREALSAAVVAVSLFLSLASVCFAIWVARSHRDD